MPKVPRAKRNKGHQAEAALSLSKEKRHNGPLGEKKKQLNRRFSQMEQRFTERSMFKMVSHAKNIVS